MTKNKNLIFFLIITVISAVTMLIYAALTGNDNQTFTDVVIEYTSIYGSNKSAERSMFYIFAVLGAVAYAGLFWLGKCQTISIREKLVTPVGFALTALLVSVATNYVIYQKVYVVLLLALLLGVAALVKNKELAIPVLSLYFISMYGLIGLYRIYVLLGGTADANINYFAIPSMVLAVVLLLVSNDSKYIYRGMQILQLFVPFTLLMYLASAYKISDGQIINVDVPKRVLFVIGLIIACFIAEAAYKLKKNWAGSTSLQAVLTYGTTVSIMAFNRYSGTGSITDLDWHHHFENVIGFSQIFELGQKPFSEYIPVSGMYSIGQGFFFWFFGHGLASFYYVTANLYFLFVILIIAFLLRKQLKAEWVLLVTLVFLVKDYNRVTLIVPVVLLLTWPALIEKKNLWLKAWFLTSFINGLYYPVFGAAVCFGFLPMGIWQIATYAKSGQLKSDVKTAKFWIWWGVCAIPVLAGEGLLIGTAKHMLAMGSQTIYADGITRFSQLIPSTFFPYVQSLSIKTVLYYLASYLVIVSIIWLAVALMLKLIKSNYTEGGLIAVSIALMLLVSFSFTVVRFDIGDIYSRSEGMVRAAAVVLTIVVARYLARNDRNILVVFAFSIFIISMVSGEAFLKVDSDEKLQSAYTVPANDAYLVDTDIRLGQCFVNVDTYAYLTQIKTYIDIQNPDSSYMGIVDSFGLFYLNDIKGCSVMEIFNTIKGLGATNETIENLRETHGIVGRNINPDSNYYFYHWLVTSGEYVWNNKLRVFVPNDGSLSKEQVLEQHKNIDLSYAETSNQGLTPGSWGSSMETLESIFTEKELSHVEQKSGSADTIYMNKAFDGDEADFIYLDFGDMTANYRYYLTCSGDMTVDTTGMGVLKNLYKKDYNTGMKVTIYFTDEFGAEHFIQCDMDEGQLLIPMGSAAGWLLNSHSEFRIVVTQDGNEIDMPEIKTIRFLKLREAGNHE